MSGGSSASSVEPAAPRAALTLVQIRLSTALAAVAGAGIFCWYSGRYTLGALAANYRWNELIFSTLVFFVLRRRSFPLAVGTAIFAAIWIAAAFLELDKILP